MTAIITIANQKGGVGKTTTAVTLAHGLALKTGQPVLLLDLDPQGQAATSLGLDPSQAAYEWLTGLRPIAAALIQARPNLHLIPGNKRTAIVPSAWQQDGAPSNHLRRLLNQVRTCRYIIIDTAPTLGDLQRQALVAADAVLIPSTCDYLALDGVAAITNTLLAHQESGWPGGLLGILPTFYDDQTAESRTNLAELRRIYGQDILNPVHRATILREATANGLTIWEHASTSRAAIEYASLIDHIVEVL